MWFKASAQISGVNEDGLNYLNIPSLMHAESVIAIFLAQAVIIGAAETYPWGGSVDDFGQGLDNLVWNILCTALLGARLQFASKIPLRFQW